jgi:methylmalonyl-CoA carboxyltransferase 1.3S subunit
LKLKITIDGKTYEVDVEAEEEVRGPGTYAYYSPRPVQTPAGAPVRPAPGGAPQAAPTAVADESKVCRSPIAGVVVRVNIHEGQQIQVDDPLIVLEAMKMETTVTSPVAGTVKTVNAVVGEGVLVGQVLVEFE